MRIAKRFLAGLPSGQRLVPVAVKSPFTPTATAPDSPNHTGGNVAAPGARSSCSTSLSHGAAECHIFPPWTPTSIIYCKLPNEAFGREVMQEAREGCNKCSFMYEGQTFKLWASPLRTKEERLRKRRLMSLATAVRAALAQGEQGAPKAPYQMVC